MWCPRAFAEIGGHGALDLWRPVVGWTGVINGTLRILELAARARACRSSCTVTASGGACT